MEQQSNSIESRTCIKRQLNLKILIPLLVLVIVGGYFTIKWISTSVWNKRLASESSVNLTADEYGTFIYQIDIETEVENQINFESSIVGGGNMQFHVSSCDLLLGSSTLRYTTERDGHFRVDSILIDNQYIPITINIRQIHDARYSTTELKITSEPGNILTFMDIDTVLHDGTFSIEFDPDSVLEGYDPNRTPTLIVTEQIRVSNASGNLRQIPENLTFRFPRVEIDVTDPWNYYISRTGSGYTIKGTGERGVRVTFSGATSGYTTIGYSETFSKWVSVPNFGENYYFLIASREGFTSDSVAVTIYREMTEAELIREYKNSCEHVTAEHVRQHQSSMVGDRVRLWGRTIEYFSGSWLHLMNGDDHWIADLTSFDRIPNLVGLSCYCWGEVTSQSESFSTSGGSYVTAPVIEAVYYEVSY